MKLKDIKTAEPFKSLFRIKKETYQEVLHSIQNNGYDPNEPILIWEEKNILIDGHTRVKAAKEMGIEEIPFLSLTFPDEYEAIKYAYRHNAMRRHVTWGDKFRCVAMLDERGEEGGDKRSKKITASADAVVASKKRTAELTGVSEKTVERVRLILDYCDEEDIEAMKNDEISITAAHKLAMEIKKEIEEAQKNAKKFNRTNDSIKWSLWTWNPVTGCKFGCKYCYARDIADRFYDEGFEPTFHEERLDAPQNMKIPKVDEPGEHNVFVCSMADLFGDWVPIEWIDKVFDAVRKAPDWWNFIFLTKNPERYGKLMATETDELDGLIPQPYIPKNCWLGATATNQKEMDKAIKSFQFLKDQFEITNKLFVSCEPLMGPIDADLSCLDWIIIGGRSKSKGMPAGQPEWEWVEDLLYDARELDLKVYFKTNLEVRPEEFPE